MNTIYLSFDGISDDIYLQARDRKMYQTKIDVIENCRKLKKDIGKCPSVVLVPTVVRGLNDHQIGDIARFAFDHADVVRGVNFQPVAFTGRITREELTKGRFTLSDLATDFSKQTGFTTKEEWFPVPVVAPVSSFASILLGEKKVTFTTHPHCGIATYVFMDDKGKMMPFPRFVNVEKFSGELTKINNKAENAMFKKLYALKVLKLLNNSIYEDRLPEGLTKRQFIKMIGSIMGSKSKKTLAAFSWKMMLFAGMHFQDSYNYDVERVRRCGVHYVTPDCQIIPFCAYNSGPEYRKQVEKKFSIPLAEWKAKNKEEAKLLEEALIVPDELKADPVKKK